MRCKPQPPAIRTGSRRTWMCIVTRELRYRGASAAERAGERLDQRDLLVTAQRPARVDSQVEVAIGALSLACARTEHDDQTQHRQRRECGGDGISQWRIGRAHARIVIRGRRKHPSMRCGRSSVWLRHFQFHMHAPANGGDTQSVTCPHALRHLLGCVLHSQNFDGSGSVQHTIKNEVVPMCDQLTHESR